MKKILVLSILLLLATASPARASWLIDRYGQLFYFPAGNILGDEDEEKDDEAEKKEEEEQKEAEKKEAEQRREAEKKQEQPKTEVQIQTEGDKQEVQMESNRGKLKIKSGGGELELELETEAGETEDLGEDDEVEIEPDEDEDKIRIATGSGEGEMVISRNRIRAKTNFPLSVDLTTNELIVTTPAGVKRVTILPDQAIANLLANDVIDRVEPENEEELELTETEEGEPAYELAGESDQEFLGFLPVKIKAKFRVSAETGEVLTSQKPLITRLLDLLSF